MMFLQRDTSLAECALEETRGVLCPARRSLSLQPPLASLSLIRFIHLLLRFPIHPAHLPVCLYRRPLSPAHSRPPSNHTGTPTFSPPPCAPSKTKVPKTRNMDMALATSGPEINSDHWQDYTPDTLLPALVDNRGHLLTALSLGHKGATPHRWIVDLAFHEIGLNPHAHVFYHHSPPPTEATSQGEAEEDSDTPLSVCCQTCFKQYTVYINTGEACKGQTHHLHSKFSDDSVVSECCHCGLQLTASLETSALPQSLLYRIRTARQPKASSLTNAPFFVDTLETLIRILQGAAKPTETGVPNSINTGSKAFISRVSLDKDM